MLDYGVAIVVAAAHLSLQLQDRAGDFLRLHRQGFLLRGKALTGNFTLYQPFIDVLQPLVKLGFPALECPQAALRLFSVKHPL